MKQIHCPAGTVKGLKDSNVSGRNACNVGVSSERRQSQSLGRGASVCRLAGSSRPPRSQVMRLRHILASAHAQRGGGGGPWRQALRRRRGCGRRRGREARRGGGSRGLLREQRSRHPQPIHDGPTHFRVRQSALDLLVRQPRGKRCLQNLLWIVRNATRRAASGQHAANRNQAVERERENERQRETSVHTGVKAVEETGSAPAQPGRSDHRRGFPPPPTAGTPPDSAGPPRWWRARGAPPPRAAAAAA